MQETYDIRQSEGASNSFVLPPTLAEVAKVALLSVSMTIVVLLLGTQLTF